MKGAKLLLRAHEIVGINSACSHSRCHRLRLGHSIAFNTFLCAKRRDSLVWLGMLDARRLLRGQDPLMASWRATRDILLLQLKHETLELFI